MSSVFSPDTKMKALQRAGFKCECCGVRLERNGIVSSGMTYHIHHRKPRSKGGTSSLINAAVVCTNCHTHLHRVQDLGFTFPQACAVVEFAKRHKVDVYRALKMMRLQ